MELWNELKQDIKQFQSLPSTLEAIAKVICMVRHKDAGTKKYKLFNEPSQGILEALEMCKMMAVVEEGKLAATTANGGAKSRQGAEPVLMNRLERMEEKVLAAVRGDTGSGQVQLRIRLNQGSRQDRETKTPNTAKQVVTISLTKVAIAEHIRKMTPRQVAEKVEEALKGCKSETLQAVKVKAVRFEGRNQLKIYADMEEEAHTLLLEADSWTPRLAKGASLVLPTYKLVLHSVPTTFHPHSEDDRNGIFYANHDVTPFSMHEI